MEGILEIKNEQGLHMRPSSQIVALCEETECEVFFEFQDQVANARNIMELMFLSLLKDDIFKVKIKSNNSDEKIAKDEEYSFYIKLKNLIEEKKFGEK